MKARILYGTETGNAEMAADEVQVALETHGIEVEVASMEDVEVGDLTPDEFLIIITSTYGEGELPATTLPFHAALVEQSPDLGGVRFAGFGLGDSSYDTYNNAIEIMAGVLAGLGAVQVGELGRHDANSGLVVTDVAAEWAKTVADLI